MSKKDWKETTLGNISTFEIGRTPARKNPDYWTDDLAHPFCSIKAMKSPDGSGFEEGVTQKAIDDKKAKKAPKGALLLSFKLSIGRTMIAPRDLYYNEAIAHIKPNYEVTNREFLMLGLQAVDWSNLGSVAIKGKTLNKKSIGAIELLLPPLDEQRRIVDLMSRFDDLIRTTDEEISAVEILRMNTLHQLLSDVGDDWEDTTLSEVASWRSGATPKATNHDFYDGGTIKWAKIGDVQNGPIYDTEVKITQLGYEQIKRLAPVNSTLIAMYGSIGRCALVKEEMATNQAILCGIPNESINPEFLFYLALSMEKHLFSLGRGAAQSNINKKIIQEQSISLPPLETQQEIVDTMSSIDNYLNALMAEQVENRNLRDNLLHTLLSGELEIPEDYDELLEATA